MPVESHIKEHPAWFHRFGVLWTPTVLIFDPEGKERYRIEGYLPRDEFRAQLELGLARVSFMHMRWEDAGSRYAAVARNYPQTAAGPEAIYWQGVCRYKGANDHAALGETAKTLAKSYSGTVWAKKSSVWLPTASGAA